MGLASFLNFAGCTEGPGTWASFSFLERASEMCGVRGCVFGVVFQSLMGLEIGGGVHSPDPEPPPANPVGLNCRQPAWLARWSWRRTCRALGLQRVGFR